MDSTQFQTAVSILFVTYILSEIPSNLVLKKLRPSRWIAFITVSWGIVATLTGIVQSYGGLIACRLLLGAVEGGLFVCPSTTTAAARLRSRTIADYDESPAWRSTLRSSIRSANSPCASGIFLCLLRSREPAAVSSPTALATWTALLGSAAG